MKERNFYSREEAEDNKINYKMQLLEYRSVIQHELDKCTGCGICVIVCPKEVIERTDSGENVTIPNIDECSFCGICDYMCPFGAWTLLINDEHKIELTETINEDLSISRNLPELIAEELVCPRTQKPVKKYLEGYIKIYPEKCPEGCKECVDPCMMDVIEFTSLDSNRKVKLNEDRCIYCTACSVICPVPEAIEVERIGIHFKKEQIRSSSVFNEIIRNLISQEALGKILGEKSQEMSRDRTLELFTHKGAPKKEES